ncbi:MAG: hypothetical protein ACJAWX_001771, partial [Algoriphagus sp.]
FTFFDGRDCIFNRIQTKFFHKTGVYILIAITNLHASYCKTG